MPNGSGAWRGRTIRWGGLLWLAVCLGAGSSGLGAEPGLQPDGPASRGAAAAPTTEVDLTPASHGVLVRPGDPLNEALAGLGARLEELAGRVEKVGAERQELAALKEQNQRLLARIEALEAERDRLPDALKLATELSKASDAASAKVRDLVEELIAERMQNARLIADLAAATAERTKIDQARAKEAARAAWIGGLHDELAEREAQLADAEAARAQSEARLEAQARLAQAERARAAKQLAAMQEQLRERGREAASVRSEGEDLRRRLDAAQAELQRRGAGNQRLAAKLAAAHRAADFAMVTAHDNVAAIEDQIGMRHVASGDLPPDPSEQSATLAGMLPAMPYPKPRLEGDETDAWAPASGPGDGEVAASAIAVMEDGAWIQASLHDTAASNGEPETDPGHFVAPDGAETGDVISAAALVADPLGPGRVGESSAEQSTPLDDWVERAGLSEAAARLADGLRATREAAMFQRRERVFTVDVEQRAFAANPAAAPVPLDPALDIHLFTARSELVGESEGGIRFYPDGSSTGGRIELELLGERAAVNVRWSTGVVTVER